MDKSRVCISRTINLAKQKCVKKTNLLVYEKATEPPKPNRPSYTLPPISAPPAKHIRVCTGAELKKMCAPKPCSCPPRPPPPGFFGLLFRFLGFGLKAGVAGGLVFWTWDIGLWGDSQKTEDLYSNVCEIFSTAIIDDKKKHSPVCEAEMELMSVPPPPPPAKCVKPPIDSQATALTIKDKWNCAVQCVFGAITGFPDNFIGFVNERILKKEEEPDCKKKS